MTTRRQLLKRGLSVSGAALAAGAMGGLFGRAAHAQQGATWHMPDEGAPHTATWMAFGPSADIWGARLLPVVREHLAAVAKAIAAHEPVKMLVREEDYAVASRLCGSSVELVQHPVDDLWMRDTGPVFVKNASGQLGGVSFNFNGWGNKQEHDQDAQVAPFVAERAGARLIDTKLVLEGGGIEVDGEGTARARRSSRAAACSIRTAIRASVRRSVKPS